LPEEVSDETEMIILEKVRAKMRASCGMLVKVVRALEAHFGKEAIHMIARKALHQVHPRPARKLGTPEDDLAAFLRKMEQGCAATHEWKRKDHGPKKVSYEFSSCMWAQVFRELNAADIGSWMCDGDDAAARSFNPNLRCKTTKTLMRGDAICNHVFCVSRRRRKVKTQHR
jgi:hypothetical protein